MFESSGYWEFERKHSNVKALICSPDRLRALGLEVRATKDRSEKASVQKKGDADHREPEPHSREAEEVEKAEDYVRRERLRGLVDAHTHLDLTPGRVVLLI